MAAEDGGKGEGGGVWRRDEEKAFENALALATAKPKDDDALADDDGLWDQIASRVPSKTVAELKLHYQILLEDVEAIESGRVPIPHYVGEEEGEQRDDDNIHKSKTTKEHNHHHHHQHRGVGGFSDKREGFDPGNLPSSKSDQERRKGIPWTEEEHRLFLLGLDKFGKGDWRSISRNFVVSRNPTQVASHAQKYFIRLNSMNRDRRRSSIHDITMVNGGHVSSPQVPITGQSSGNPTAMVASSSLKHHSQHQQQPSMPSVGMYGPPMGHPVTGHMVSAVGTPVMLPPGHVPYVMPVAYPVPPSTMHQ